jgi:TonB family protein
MAMDALLSGSRSDQRGEIRWRKMFVISLCFHLAIFSLVFFVPEPIPARRIKGVVYEVDLVEMPPVKANDRPSRTDLKSPAKSEKALRIPPKAAPAKRFGHVAPEEKPIVIAKRTLEKKNGATEKPKSNPSRLIDQAVSKIEEKVKKEEKDPLNQALSDIEGRVKAEGDRPSAEPGPQTGIAMRMYSLEVEEKIKSNWAYPVDVLSPESRKDLEAVVIVRVRSNGDILKSWFQKRSGNGGFDQSVMTAIERSHPLPSFPPGYVKSSEEIEINFNLSELEKG